MMKSITLIANGDLRAAANRKCWPVQHETEQAIMRAVRERGHTIERGHDYDEEAGHGFIDSQKRGLEVFRTIDPQAPLIVVEAVWQYSQHLLGGLLHHKGPILTIANWSGEWPGLVGLLNLNASLRKAGKEFDTLWSVDFTDTFFLDGLARWLDGKRIEHDASHVRHYGSVELPQDARELGTRLAQDLRRDKAIIGVFDEGCMGMYNAIIPDELLHPMGLFKERLSQSGLYAEMRATPDEEARAAYDWLLDKGMTFNLGSDEETELTEAQVLEQLKMYIAALRIADTFGCETIGIQYQQGLKDICAASDLAEGLLNNADRPPVKSRDGRELWPGEPLPHFNEVDEGVAVDAICTNRIWKEMGLDCETTLHDVRWGEDYDGRFVWVFEISGSVPPAHFANGYADAEGERQPPMYFRLGGSTIKGVSKPGHVVWSRIYVEPDGVKADIGLCEAVELPQEETERRWVSTTPEWPMMHVVMPGISRDQFMARHCSNHIQVAYAPDEETATRAMATKAAMFAEMGMDVAFCGDNPLTVKA
mgnify:CR=1 FL=1